MLRTSPSIHAIRSPRRVAGRTIAALAISAMVVTGCSSTKESASTDAAAVTDTAITDTAAAADTGAASETIAAADGDSAETTAAAAAPSGGVVLSDGEAPADRQIVLSATGFSPATMTIKNGEKVTFTTTEGIYGVIVGDLDGATVTKGLFETFTFSTPGTYPVREDVSGATATIVVE